jgi:hypothetical protein
MAYYAFRISCSTKLRYKTHRCSSHNAVEVTWIALHGFKALPAASTTSEIVRLIIRHLVVLCGYLFANHNTSMEATIDKIMDDIRIFVKCLYV